MTRLTSPALALAGVLFVLPGSAQGADGNAELNRLAIGVAAGRVALCEAIAAAEAVAQHEPGLLRAVSDRESYREALYARAARALRSAQTDVRIDWAIEDLRCLAGYRDARALLARAEARRSEVALAAKRQEAGRRDPACTARAISEGLCADLADRGDVKDGLAEQHRLARETGAIDLDELAQRADALEAIDARVEEEEARYRAVAGRPFDRRVCSAQVAFRAR